MTRPPFDFTRSRSSCAHDNDINDLLIGHKSLLQREAHLAIQCLVVRESFRNEFSALHTTDDRSGVTDIRNVHGATLKKDRDTGCPTVAVINLTHVQLCQQKERRRALHIIRVVCSVSFIPHPRAHARAPIPHSAATPDGKEKAHLFVHVDVCLNELVCDTQATVLLAVQQFLVDNRELRASKTLVNTRRDVEWTLSKQRDCAQQGMRT
jgi:hypothetical protein